MNKRVVLLLLLLLPFSALTLHALLAVGYWGILEAALANPGSWQIGLDLVIACLLACTWMLRDAHERGARAWPFVLITLGAGSFGPLFYLLRREWGRNAAG